ncbi:MAG: N-acetylmuramoyl-L-alanine amidase [Lachnospiraceae bacterium]|nr:N-acetylmuramoyl-L-alanine amidase [Lachnospiraceae bacterium]
MKNYYLPLISILLLALSILTYYKHCYTPTSSSINQKKIIVIDVGHGGSDPGKVSANGIEEKDINLEIAGYLKDYLIAQGFTVHLTRETDDGLYEPDASNKKRSDMNNRIQFFKDKNAALVVSIHQNSYPDSFQHGAQTFYYTNSDTSKLLAESIQASLLSIDDTNTRAAKSSDSYFILKNSSAPAVIIECGFLSNPEEAAKLTDPNYQKKIAYAISIGICTYHTSKKPSPDTKTREQAWTNPNRISQAHTLPSTLNFHFTYSLYVL